MTAKCVTTSQERQDFDTQDFDNEEGVSPTLKGASSGTNRAPTIHGQGVRRLTPVECERLQGFPDGWTIPDETAWQDHPGPDGPRYAQMGNAVTVPVAEWIGRRIMSWEQL